jgi:hypothetical protein
MSSQYSAPNYTYSLVLLDSSGLRTGTISRVLYSQSATSTQAAIVSGDLTPWFIGMELENTGIQTTNNAIIRLRIDALGTFIRAAPILTDQNAKFNFMLEAQISQTLNGVTTNGKLFRVEINNIKIQEDDNIGEVLVIVARCREYALKDNISSHQLYFQAPQDAMNSIITDYNVVSANGMSIGSTTLNIPNNASLKQNWIPLGPQTSHELLLQIIDRLAQAPAQGGVLTDYYFDFDAENNNIKFVDIIADVFGGVDSGVVINPITFANAAQKQKLIQTDSLKFKNLIIARCGANSGTLPMNQCRFASIYTHAVGVASFGGRPEWNIATYNKGDQVKVTNTAVIPNTIRFYTCKTNNFASGTNPTSDSTNWVEDFSTDPTSSVYFTYTPWTYHIGDFIRNLSGDTTLNSIILPVFSSPIVVSRTYNSYGYIGACVDHNFVRANYDRNNITNQYENISMKWVTACVNNPPSVNTPLLQTQLYYQGQRFLIGSSGSPSGWNRNDLGSVANRVAEWNTSYTDSSGNIISRWEISDAPVEGDTVNDLNTGTTLRFTGGTWTIGWQLSMFGQNSGITDPQVSMFHPVASIASVTGPTQIVGNSATGSSSGGEAIELTYNWNTTTATPHNIVQNRASRGVWMNLWFPYPRLSPTTITSDPHFGIGHEYGSRSTNLNTTMGVFNTENLYQTRQGLIGWNRGIDSEDLGRISALRFKMRVTFMDLNGNLVSDISDIPMRMFAVDMFDRVFFSDFKLRRNGQFDTVRVPVGFRAPKNLYVNRVDELSSWLGWTLPEQYQFLQEREYSGIDFDWRFVRMIGFQWQGCYDSNGFYNGQRDQFIQNLGTHTQQTAIDAGNFIINNNPFNLSAPNPAPTIAKTYNYDIGKIAIDELYFEKELYCTSNYTGSQIINPRIDVVHSETEVDYLTGRNVAQGAITRAQFYPQDYHVTSYGNVNLKFGQKFTVTGPTVPGSTMTLYCNYVKHIIDVESYKMEIVGKNKFAITPTIGMANTSVQSGFGMTVSGMNYSGVSVITIKIDGTTFFPPPNTITTDANGTFNSTFFVPGLPWGSVGNHTISATDSDGHTASMSFTVTS